MRVEGVTLRDPPSGWSFWVNDCDRVRFRGVDVLTNMEYPNNDGIHVNCSRDVLISDCRIETGDDAIIVRANSASLAAPKPCERVAVVNCSLRSYANAIRVGWLNDGIIRNCTFIPAGGRKATGNLIGGSYSGKHDFGYVCHMPKRILVDGLRIDDSNHPDKYQGPTIFAVFNKANTSPAYVEQFPYQITQEVVLKNVTTASGRPLNLSANPYMFRNVKIVRPKE